MRYRRALNSNLLISRKWRYLSPFLVKIHVEIMPYKTARYEPPEGAKRLRNQSLTRVFCQERSQFREDALRTVNHRKKCISVKSKEVRLSFRICAREAAPRRSEASAKNAAAQVALPMSELDTASLSTKK